jgi:HK97 family phage prohead protease
MKAQDRTPARKRAGTAAFELKPRPAILAAGAEGIVEGYASLFGAVDQAGDRVAPGAFAASLKRRGAAGVRMLYQHLAVEPVGVWTLIREDARGLFVRGRIVPEVARAREVLSLLRAGAIDGLSIGYRTVAARKGPGETVRTLTEIDLWEVSIVTFPMLEGARVTGVKARAPEERWTQRIPMGKDGTKWTAVWK